MVPPVNREIVEIAAALLDEALGSNEDYRRSATVARFPESSAITGMATRAGSLATVMDPRYRDIDELRRILNGQPEHCVLVNVGVAIAAQPVGGSPELLVELAEKGLAIGGRHSGRFASAG